MLGSFLTIHDISQALIPFSLSLKKKKLNYSDSYCTHPPGRWEGELVGDDLALSELHLMQGGGRENESELRRSWMHSKCAASLVSMTRTENESQPC